MRANKITSVYIAEMGILLALTAALSYIDSRISAAFPMNIRLGIANIAILIALVKHGTGPAGLLAVLRSGFSALTRGATAGIMSLGGGIFSFIVTAMLIRTKHSYRFTCMIAAICHILGQLAVSCVLTGSAAALLYAPVLIPAAVITGMLTGTISEQCIKRIGMKKD